MYTNVTVMPSSFAGLIFYFIHNNSISNILNPQELYSQGILPDSSYSIITLTVSKIVQLNTTRKTQYNVQVQSVPNIIGQNPYDFNTFIDLKISSMSIQIYTEFNPIGIWDIISGIGGIYSVLKAIEAFIFVTNSMKSRFIFDKHAKKRDDFIDNTQYKLLTEGQNS